MSLPPSPAVEEAYRRSIAQLKRNACVHGFLASPVDRRNYRALWARDGCICAVAAYVSGEEELIESARRTLRTLARYQADNGQMPSYLIIHEDDSIGEINYGGKAQITSIDSSLWFMFACQAAFHHRREGEFIHDRLYGRYREVIRYLLSIDANSCGLLEIPVAGDWTDILDRSYHVLYDQVLWYRALVSAAELARHAGKGRDDEYYSRRARLVRQRLNEDFWWEDADVVRRVAQKYAIANPLPENPSFPYYQSHLKPFSNYWTGRFDAFANVLAALMGVAPPDRTDAIVGRVMATGLDQPLPLRVLDPPIRKSDPDADQLRISDEPPFVYHNGGTWPLAGGFWVALLAKLGRKAEAAAALERLAAALKAPAKNGAEWDFCEYFHGQTHEPMGMRDITWNGAAYLLAYHAHVHGHLAYFERPDEA